jgi:hypothetical protein
VITVANNETFTAEDIRLIVNETQKKVIASSMQKDNVIDVTGNVITFANTLPALATGDILTVEIDFSISSMVDSVLFYEYETILDTINGEII